MATGPEHYAEAERLMQLALDQRFKEVAADPAPLSMLTMAQAQVHATLAHAAATMDSVALRGNLSDQDKKSWTRWRLLLRG